MLEEVQTTKRTRLHTRTALVAYIQQLRHGRRRHLGNHSPMTDYHPLIETEAWYNYLVRQPFCTFVPYVRINTCSC
jgi:hypothetical protein